MPRCVQSGPADRARAPRLLLSLATRPALFVTWVHLLLVTDLCVNAVLVLDHVKVPAGCVDVDKAVRGDGRMGVEPTGNEEAAESPAPDEEGNGGDDEQGGDEQEEGDADPEEGEEDGGAEGEDDGAGGEDDEEEKGQEGEEELGDGKGLESGG